MEILDWAAILGALAWLPQVFSWLHEWLQKPSLKIYHDEEAEVGFIKFGNAFNIRISLLAEKKHALIDDIRLNIQDKDGAIHAFKWIWYSETFYELQAPTGTATMAKQQNAIAINTYKDVLIEKFVGFQSCDFLNKRKELAYKLINYIENQKKGETFDVDTIRRSNEYNDLLRLYKNSMIWKVGSYSATCKLHIANSNKDIEHKFKFNLSDIEIENLKKNIEFLSKVIDTEFLPFTNEKLEGNWNWVKPNIQNYN